MYIKRHVEITAEKLSQMFGAVLIAGPRQVGKTTMLENMTKNINYVSMDDPILRASVEESSSTFFKDNPPPIFVDEIQKAPELFNQIKLLLDRSHKKGQFFMCGSQQFRMMKGVSESLAGRIGLCTLLGFSIREMHNVDFYEPFIPTEEYFEKRKKTVKEISYDDVWYTIWRGSMPELLLNPDFDWNFYYSSYVRTYIERDVHDLTVIGDTIKFTNFMIAAAASIGQLLNLSSLARDVGISTTTAERWMSVLVASNIVYLLQPYHNNITKRAVKTPKLYFLDTGLAAYLTKWNSTDVLKTGAMAGAFFENFVLTEIIKSYYNSGIQEPPLYFYRDKDMNEIDIVIEKEGTLYPIEIKKHADPKKTDAKAFHLLQNIPNKTIGQGGIICLYDNLLSFGEDIKVIPIKYL